MRASVSPPLSSTTHLSSLRSAELTRDGQPRPRAAKPQGKPDMRRPAGGAGVIRPSHEPELDGRPGVTCDSSALTAVKDVAVSQSLFPLSLSLSHPFSLCLSLSHTLFPSLFSHSLSVCVSSSPLLVSVALMKLPV